MKCLHQAAPHPACSQHTETKATRSAEALGALPAYVSVAGRTVHLPEGASPQSGSDCAGCGYPHASPVAVAPGPYGITGRPRNQRPVLTLSLCTDCEEKQRRGRFPWLFIAAVSMCCSAAHAVVQISTSTPLHLLPAGLLMPLAMAAVYLRFNAPVYLTYQAHRGELSFRFQRRERAIPFAKANGWRRASK